MFNMKKLFILFCFIPLVCFAQKNGSYPAQGSGGSTSSNTIYGYGFVTTTDSRALRFSGGVTDTGAGFISSALGGGFTDNSGIGFISANGGSFIANANSGFLSQGGGSGSGYVASAGAGYRITTGAGNFQILGTGSFIGNGSGLTNIADPNVAYVVNLSSNYIPIVRSDRTLATNVNGAVLQVSDADLAVIAPNHGNAKLDLIAYDGAAMAVVKSSQPSIKLTESSTSFGQTFGATASQISGTLSVGSAVISNVVYSAMSPLGINPVFQNTNVTLAAAGTFTWTFITPYAAGDTNYSISIVGAGATIAAPIIGAKLTNSVTLSFTPYTGIINLIAIHQ